MFLSIRSFLHIAVLALVINCLFVTPALAQNRWVDSQTHDDVVYFISAQPAELARYDLEAGTFLPTISLSSDFGKASALYVDDDGIFVALDQQILKVDVSNGSTEFFANIDGDVWGLGAIGDNLYAATTIGDQHNSLREHIYRYQKSTGIYQQNKQHYIRRGSWLVSPEAEAILGVQPGQKPYRLSIEASGAFGEFEIYDFAHNLGYNEINLFPLENGNRILYANGMVADAITGEYLNVIPGNSDIIDVVEYENELFLLRSDRIERLNSDYLRIGAYAIDDDTLFGLSIIDTGTNGATLFAFGADLSLEVQELFPISIALDVIGTEALEPTLDPDTDYVDIDQLVTASNGDAFVLDQYQRSILEWSDSQQAYTNVIRLFDQPNHISWRSGSRDMFVSYDEGRVTRVDLDTGIETGFYNSPFSVDEILATEEFLVITSGQYFQRTVTLLSYAGELLNEIEWDQSVSTLVWSDVNRLLYLYDGGSYTTIIAALPINDQFEFGEKLESEELNSFQRLQAPLKLSPDQTLLVDGSGVLFNAETLELVAYLLEPVVDAAWTADGLLLTITRDYPYRLQQWSANYELQREYSLGSFSDTPNFLNSNGVRLFTNQGIASTQSILLTPGGNDIDGDGIPDAIDTDPELVAIELGDGSWVDRQTIGSVEYFLNNRGQIKSFDPDIGSLVNVVDICLPTTNMFVSDSA